MPGSAARMHLILQSDDPALGDAVDNLSQPENDGCKGDDRPIISIGLFEAAWDSGIA